MIKSKTNNYWLNENSKIFLEFIPSLKQQLYKRVSKILHKHEVKNVIDYGCGEGNQLKFLDSKIKIDLYDINLNVATEAFNKYKNKFDLNLLKFPKKFKKHFYDAVIVNMVWMCLSSDTQVDSLIKHIKFIKKRNGILIISMTHPCFRAESFSYYETDFSLKKTEFNYTKSFTPFNVYIKDKSKTVFIDFHNSLDYIFKKLINNNFSIIGFDELYDIKHLEFKNNKFNPYLILTIK